MRDNDSPHDLALRRAITELRAEPEPRPEWLASVLDAAAAQRFDDVAPRHDDVRRWSFRPSVAIAASVLFAAVGAGITYSAMRGLGATDFTQRMPVAAPAAGRPASQVRFTLVAPGAASVTLVGDFNAWNPTALPMRRTSNGEVWEVEIPLAPGRYTYSFLVDGRLARDPSAAEAARDDFGSPSSVLLVKGS